MRFGRVLAQLAPDRAGGARPRRADGDPGVPFPARIGPDGEPIVLLEQDRSKWDQLSSARAGGAWRRPRRSAAGPVHAAGRDSRLPRPRTTGEDTDWARIALLYAELMQVTPSPMVELNRAVAVSMAVGPEAGLELIDMLIEEPSMKSYHLLPSVRGDFLHKLGRLDEARAEFERAASLTRNSRERDLLLSRAAACAG